MLETIRECTTPDGYRLQYRSWQTGQSDTLVVTLHGILTHSGWFGEVGDDLLARGIHTIGHDRRGSGLNDEARGDVSGPEQLVGDLAALIATQRARYSRIVLLGWCLGSCIALHHLLQNEDGGEGLILMSPDIFECHLDEKVRATFSDPKWDTRVMPRLRVPINVEIYTTSHYLETFIKRDALKLKEFTPRFLRASMRLKEDLETHFAAFTKPSLLLLAGRDQIIDNEKTRALYAHIGSASPEIVELDSDHGLMFDAREELVATIARFAETVVSRRSAAKDPLIGTTSAQPEEVLRRPSAAQDDSRAQIVSIEVIPLEIPFRRTFAHARNAHSAARPQLIRLTLSDGTVGWGEAQPREYVTGESIASVHAAVQILAAQWSGRAIDGLDSASALARSSPLRLSAPAAFAGVELALLDAAGRLEGRNVTEILGSVKTSTLLYHGAVLGFLPTAAFGLALGYLRRLGKTIVKLKVGRDDDRERVATARRILGGDVRIILDANAAWTPAQAIVHIRSLEDLDVDIVEQPVPREDFPGMAVVRAAVKPRIMADESLCTIDDARELLAHGSADVWNVRVGKCGGLLAAAELLDLAAENAIECHLGVMVGETGIAGTAGRLLAACRTDLRHLEFDETGNATADVLRQPLARISGLHAPLPPLRPGLGFDVDLRAIEALRIRSVAA
ncbi:MAG: alpha/beta fold hydrolase [Thermoanaerobaculia bacterium]